MRRRTRWLAGVAGLVILLPVLAVAIVAVRLDPNDFQPALVEAVRHATGRTLRIAGGMRLAWSLSPTVEARDVTLSNLPGGSRPEMASAERIEISLAIPALLRREIEFTNLTLIGPNILFEDVGGKPNWRFDLPESADGAPAPAPSTAPSASYALAIRRAHVQNGLVTWRFPARTKRLGIRTMDVQHPQDEGPIDARGTLVYSDNQPFELSISTRPTAGLAGPWDTRLGFAAFDTTATATGTMDTAGQYDLQVEATSGSVDKLNALLPEMRLPRMHNAVLSAKLLNGKRPGDLPTLGASKLRFADADLAPQLPGVVLGATELALDKPGGLATVQTSGRYGAQPFAVSGTVGVPVHADEPAKLPVDLQAKAPSGGKTASGSLGLKGQVGMRNLAYDGMDATVSLDTPSLAAWRPLVWDALPELTKVHFAGRLTLPAKPASMTFGNARLTTEQGDLAGSGSLALAPAPALKAKLHSEQMDLEAMLDAFGVDLSPASRPAGGPVISDTPIDWSALRGPAVDVATTVATLRFQDQAWRGVDLNVRVQNGHLEEGSLKWTGPSGPVSVSVAADAAGSAVPVRLAMTAPSLPFALVARYAGLPGPVTGTAKVEAHLQGRGRSLREMAASLDGTATVAAVDGRMTNAAFIKLASASLEPLGIKVPATGDTAVRCLGVSASFKQGIGKLDPVALETTYLSLTGSGTVDLREEKLALNLSPLALVAGSMVSVPVVVEGPFRNPSGRADVDLGDKIGIFFSALGGDDRSTACVDAGLLPRPPAR